MSNYIEDQVLASSQPLRLRGSIGKTNTNIESTNTINSRRLEDVNVDYWRQRAGWADDDATMKSYNQGVYNTYNYGNDSSSSTGGSVGTAPKTKKFSLDHMGWILGFASTFIFLIMLVKCCSSAPTKKSKSSSSKKGKGSKDKSKDKEEGRSRSRSRSRTRSGRSASKSRGRSKSKSRSGKKDETSSDYKLMSDDDTKSTKSTRSRSRSRSKSVHRSRGRSKSKTRTSVSTGTDDKATKKESVDPEQKMLV